MYSQDIIELIVYCTLIHKLNIGGLYPMSNHKKEARQSNFAKDRAGFSGF